MSYPTYLIHFNKNHNPKNGQFDFGDGDGDGQVNDRGNGNKKVDLLDNPMNHYKEYKNNEGSYTKRMSSAAETGIKALQKLGDKDVEINSPENWEYWFLFETSTIGYATIADLANQGKTASEIKKIIDDSYKEYAEKHGDVNGGVWSLGEYATQEGYHIYNTDKYIDACIEVVNENKDLKQSSIQELGNYLCHINNNHSSHNGQFINGDGDGDGIIDDHHNYSRNKVDGKYRLSVNPFKTAKNVGQAIAYRREQPLEVKVHPKTLKALVGLGKGLAGMAFSKTKYGQILNDYKMVINYGKQTVQWDKIMEGSNWENYKQRKSNEMYMHAATFINRYL